MLLSALLGLTVCRSRQAADSGKGDDESGHGSSRFSKPHPQPCPVWERPPGRQARQHSTTRAALGSAEPFSHARGGLVIGPGRGGEEGG